MVLSTLTSQRVCRAGRVAYEAPVDPSAAAVVPRSPSTAFPSSGSGEAAGPDAGQEAYTSDVVPPPLWHVVEPVVALGLPSRLATILLAWGNPAL